MDFSRHPARAELRRLYDEADALFVDASCDASTECCRFGVTGREPYPTAVELAELEVAVRARGGLPRRRALPVAGERRCPILGDDGRCAAYASRPFGCRTFFCDRAILPPRSRRKEVLALGRAIATLAERVFPGTAAPRPLSRAFGADKRRPSP